MQDTAQVPPQQVPSESLEDQNIFFLLGVNDGSEEDKEKFLDELQQVIWEDFLEFDVKLLITNDEYTEFKKLLDEPSANDLEKQEKLVVYLEKLVPDLEEIMLEKALELKGDMFKERIAGMKEYHTANPDALSNIDRAEFMMAENKWRSAAELLNSISA